jgi:hypothetical protein
MILDLLNLLLNNNNSNIMITEMMIMATFMAYLEVMIIEI